MKVDINEFNDQLLINPKISEIRQFRISYQNNTFTILMEPAIEGWGWDSGYSQIVKAKEWLEDADIKSEIIKDRENEYHTCYLKVTSTRDQFCSLFRQILVAIYPNKNDRSSKKSEYYQRILDDKSFFEEFYLKIEQKYNCTVTKPTTIPEKEIQAERQESNFSRFFRW